MNEAHHRAMSYKSVIPWGRSLFEYRLMFSLSETMLKKRIIGFGDGPSSFNAELTAQGGSVISLDPIYSLSTSEIRKNIEQAIPEIISKTTADQSKFNWNMHGSVEKLIESRKRSMELFLDDFQTDSAPLRYLPEALPHTNQGEKSFDLALCSHLLFLYSELLSYEFHEKSIHEMIRTSSEVRIFPLIDLEGSTSAHLKQICRYLDTQGWNWSIEKVDYEFQKGADHQLIISGN